MNVIWYDTDNGNVAGQRKIQFTPDENGNLPTTSEQVRTYTSDSFVSTYPSVTNKDLMFRFLPLFLILMSSLSPLMGARLSSFKISWVLIALTLMFTVQLPLTEG